MKRLLILICIMLVCCAAPVYGHSGGTDSSGGHWDKSTGEYHYHHGYSAHQHPGGVCPYTKKEKTNTENANNRIITDSIKESVSINAKENKGVMNSDTYIFASLIVWVLMIGVTLSYRKDSKEVNKKMRDLYGKIRDLEKERNELIEISKKQELTIKGLEEERQLQSKIESEKINTGVNWTVEDIKKLSCVPEGVTFDEKGLPHYYVNETVERNFHVYVSFTGKCYHRTHGCSGATLQKHLYQCIPEYKPCERCVPYNGRIKQVPKWYLDFLYYYKQLDVKSDKQKED